VSVSVSVSLPEDHNRELLTKSPDELRELDEDVSELRLELARGAR
jgi:hypothetical protein